MATLQSRLKDLRKAKSQSQRQIVEEINSQFDASIALQNYANWERSANPKLQDLILLADYYDVTLDYLVGRNEYSRWGCKDFVETFGLTDEAIRGLEMIRRRSFKENNQLKALNYLLETSAKQTQRNFSYLLSLISNCNLFYDPKRLRHLNISDKDKTLIQDMMREGVDATIVQNLRHTVSYWRNEFQNTEVQE